MYGLLMLSLVIVWFPISFLVARWIGKRISPKPLGIAVTAFLSVLLFVLPVVDEVIGKYQFDRLCKEAEEVKIYDSMPVGEGLYTADGKWRLGQTSPRLSLQESKRVQAMYESLLRYEFIPPSLVGSVMPIYSNATRIYSRRDNRLLASYRHYSTRGGWLSQKLQKPLLVNDQCFPPLAGHQLSQVILPFKNNKGETK